MYAKSIRPSAKRKVQKERSATIESRDENVPGQIFYFNITVVSKMNHKH